MRGLGCVTTPPMPQARRPPPWALLERKPKELAVAARMKMTGVEIENSMSVLTDGARLIVLSKRSATKRIDLRYV
jgi:hypothetical protein